MKVSTLIIVFSLFLSALFAQQTQKVKGVIIDKESKSPLTGAVIVCTDVANGTIGGEADSNGVFIIAQVPIGKRQFAVHYVGYQDQTLTNIEVSSGKEVYLTIELEERVTKLSEVKVAAYDNKKAISEMATVSTRMFDVHETERYAGSRQDPARMASNFAGVQGTDDSRNDIVVRGNSPLGVVWNLEDVAIFNPNHFAIPGTSGGPLSIINNKYLANSDFMTGAFSAEYGNAVASVFDLKMRNGNKDKFEFTGQIGILGTEASAEGPLSKKHKASFLVTYRYSNFKFLDKLHVPIGTNSIPEYQDAAFRFNYPINKRSKIAVFGVGGWSNIDLIVSKFTRKPKDAELYGESDRDQYFKSIMGVVGASYSYSINATTYTKLTVTQQVQNIAAHHVRVYRNADYAIDSMKNILGYTFKQAKTAMSWFINKKYGAATTVKAGFQIDRYDLHYLDSIREYTYDWRHRWDYDGTPVMLQPYIQLKHRINDNFFYTAGLHVQYFSLTKSKSFEPRLGARYAWGKQQSLSIGYGMHSQLQPLYAYFFHFPNQAPHNMNMDFTRSHQFVVGYDKVFSTYFRLKAEAYYQYLFNVPIEKRAGSSFSMLNEGSAFTRIFADTLVNKGTGSNVGVELTLEKFFSKHYFMLLTGSLYDSKAKGQDGVNRSTDFNGNFATNAVAGCEYPFKKSSINLSGKITWGGGKRNSPFDTLRSRLAGEGVVVDNQRNATRLPNYFRFDVKMGWKHNGTKHKVTHEIAIDLINLTNHRNMLGYTYQPDNVKNGKDPQVMQYQLGFLPLLYYKIDF